MLYENYQEKIRKIANFLSKVVRLLPVIIPVVSVVIVTSVTLLATKGLASKVTCAAEVTYGESYSCEAKAFLSEVRIEYSPVDSEEWSEIQPRYPGQYQTRAVGISSFDKDRYGKVGYFTILPRPVDVSVQNERIVYGNFPTVTAETVYGDRFSCEGVKYADIAAESTSVTPDLSKIRFTNRQGEDVTTAYQINAVTSGISFEKRKLEVTVDSSEKVYDGVPLGYDRYAITSGALGLDDSIGAVFTVSITDVGSAQNVPEIKITHIDGERVIDVTGQYDIDMVAGELTVLTRTLLVNCGDLSAVYTGSEIDHKAFVIDDTTSLVEGHIATVVASSAYIDCGNHPNGVEIRITDAEGNDKTANYSIFYRMGTISITPKPITVSTGSASWVYDGETHIRPEYEAEGLVQGHRGILIGPAVIETVGTLENKGSLQIVDADTNDVSSNYDITYVYGTLAITPRAITVKTEDAKWIYDGYAHSQKGFVIDASTPLAKGDSFAVVRAAEITDVGKASNEFKEIRITNTGNVDRTNCYAVAYDQGTLEVVGRPVSIKPEDTEKVYDSTPLYGGEPKVTEDSEFTLVSGHRIVAEKVGSRTDAGSSASGLKNIRILAGERDVTANYAITAKDGTITVTKRPITIATASDEKDYDGRPLTNSGHSIAEMSPYQLVVGHKINMQVTGSQTEIGQSDNHCTESATTIKDQSRDVTGNYEISYEYGTLKVNAYAKITVLTATATKIYDGRPLRDGDYDVVINEGKLLSGHSVKVDVYGSITEPGTTENTASARVVDSRGWDVTANYELYISPGLLTVTHDDDPIMYIGKIKNDRDGVIYLRMDSYGDYTGQGFLGAVPYGKTLPGGYSYNYLTSVALLNSGGTIDFVEVADCKTLMLPYYMGFDGTYERPSSDTSYRGNVANYVMSYYSIPSNSNGFDYLKGHLGEYASYEEEYRQFVHDHYLNLDDETRAYMEALIAREGFNISDPNVILKVARYIQGAARYSLDYDLSLDIEKNMAIAFLETYKVGKCVHYATAATVLYRALGIPARYVTGFMVETYKDTFVDITTPGHAWVEVYIDGVGWIQVEVTGSDSGNHNNMIEITPTYLYKSYDGTYLYAENKVDADGLLSTLLEKGYTYEVKVSGAQLNVGKSASVIESFTLFDPYGNDVTDRYKIHYREGVLQVYPANREFVKVYLYQLQKYYDGTPLMFEDGDYEIIEAESGVTLDISFNISQTDVGSVTLAEINENIDQYVSYRVYKNGMDMTQKYILIFETFDHTEPYYVPLRVDPRSVELASATQSKLEDGEALSNSTVTISQGSLVVGHRLEAFAIGYIDAPGSVDNIIDVDNVKVYDREGKNVTQNYIFSTKEGVLTIISLE